MEIEKLKEELSDSDVCRRCRKCCQVQPFEIRPNKKLIDFFQTVGYKLFNDTILKKLFIVVPIQCQHLSARGCEIYDSRPELCRAFPYDVKNLDSEWLNKRCDLVKLGRVKGEDKECTQN